MNINILKPNSYFEINTLFCVSLLTAPIKGTPLGFKKSLADAMRASRPLWRCNHFGGRLPFVLLTRSSSLSGNSKLMLRTLKVVLKWSTAFWSRAANSCDVSSQGSASPKSLACSFGGNLSSAALVQASRNASAQPQVTQWTSNTESG